MGGAGYDDTLPSKKPFMFVESHDRRNNIGIIAFGAFNAMGLIGSEKGGVALVSEDPPSVLATLDIPWKPEERARVAKELLTETNDDDVLRSARNLGFAFRF